MKWKLPPYCDLIPARRLTSNALRLLLLGSLFLPALAGTQVFDPNDRRLDTGNGRPQAGEFDRRSAEPQEQRVARLDTFKTFLFTVDDPNNERPYLDSTLQNFQRYDPTRKAEFDYGHLGILGSGAYPLRYEPLHRRGLDLGTHQFDLYRRDGRSLEYMRLVRPFTQLTYVQGSEQADGMIDVKFSRNFSDGVNFVLDYGRTTQLGTSDQYPSQNLRNTNIATGFWIDGPGGRYDAFLSFSANTFEQQQNGGLIRLPTLEGEFETPFSAESRLTQARLRQAEREWMLTHTLKFGGKTDTTGRTRRAFTLTHQAIVGSRKQRLSSPLTLGDTAFYNLFPELLVDQRGQRNLTEVRYIENSFRLATFRAAGAAGRLVNAASVQRDVLEVGLTHRYNDIYQEPRDSVVNNLLLTGRIGLRPSDRLRLLVNAQLNLLDQLTDYRVAADIFFDLGAAGRLEGKFINQRYRPSLFQTTYRLSGQDVWQTDFTPTLETNLTANYLVPGVRIRLGAGYTLLNNYVYFDSTGRVQQSGGPVSIVQFTAERDLRFGAFHLDNRVLLQTVDSEVIPLPKLVGEHSLYYSGFWFKVLNVRLGFDLRYTNDFRAAYYNPVIQQYTLQDRSTTGFTPQVDAFFAMRVTKFRFFVKMEQLNTVWNDQLFYLTADYPYPDAALRLGISWRLLD